MSVRERGHYFLESLIVLAVAIIAGLVWWPMAKAQGLATQERRTISTMRLLGEKLEGATDLRSLVKVSRLSDGEDFVFQTENLAENGAYLFRLSRLGEQAMLYAWPLDYGKTGHAAFFFDPARPLLESRNHRRQYSGVRRQPQEKAALPSGSDNFSSAFGKDAQEWRPVRDEGS